MKPLTPLELQHITLEDIQRMKGEVRLDIDRQKENFSRKMQQLMSPYYGMMSGGGLMGTLHTAYAIFSGVTTGIKIMRSIRRMFR